VLLLEVDLAQVQAGAVDLSTRQTAILLLVYLEAPPHTVRGLAARLGVSKPVITRALDTLGRLDLLARQRDHRDRRNILVQRTAAGARHVEGLGTLVATLAEDLMP
jgi:DNA-binding MarR family transcriptional regulator